MRELTTAEVETVSGGLTPAEGISATLGMLGLAAVVGAAAPVFVVGFGAITAIAVIDMLHQSPATSGHRATLGSAGGPSNTKDACA